MIDRGRGLGEADTLPSYSGVQRIAESRRTEATDARVSDWKAQLESLVAEELHEIQQVIQHALRSRFEEVNELCRSSSVGAGKKLRPTLAVLCAKASLACEAVQPSKRYRQDLVYSAAAIELVHAASLVHDDVMDGAAIRRHRPTVCNLAGDSAAVLLGDYLFTKAYDLAARCRSSIPAKQIARAAASLCEGELRQQCLAQRWDMGIREYRRILALKTGSLCAASCRLGAWSVGLPRNAASKLARFGMQLGIAFQIVDDWLDYWGEEKVGKTLGTDLGQGKPTLPVLRLLATLNAKRREEFLLRMRSDEIESSQKMDWVRKLLEQSDASDYTRRRADLCVASALQSLAVLPPGPFREQLALIAQSSVARQA